MPSTSAVSQTTDQDVNGLLSGVKWAVLNLSYSFPASGSFYGSTSYSFDNEHLNNFEALNPAQQAAARTALALYASYTGLTFAELTESATIHAHLRLAESDDPSTAWAYYPHPAAAGGDVWVNHSRNRYDAPMAGNYAYHTFVHELGHSLGLEHGHDTGDGDAMTPAHDSMEYSVMTYRSYKSQTPLIGYTNESWGFAQTPMMYDIAALQHMYGANYQIRAGNTTYSWNPATGEASIDEVAQGAPGANRVFMTLWDGGGIDTYDFSNYTTGVSADLHPGAWTKLSMAQRAYLGNGNYAEGNVANALLYHGDPRSLIENVIGTAYNDTLTGNDGDNVFYYRDGLDTIDGSGSADTIDFSGFGAAMWVWLGHSSSQAQTRDQPTLTVGTWRTAAHLTNVENVVGTAHADYLAGNAQANRIDGGSGNDFVETFGGDDVLAMGAGSGYDMLYGGTGTDTVDFSGFGAAIWVWLDHSMQHAQTMDLPGLTGGNWRNVANVTDVENVVGSAYADYLAGDANANRIEGGPGNDTVETFGGDDVLAMGAGSGYDMLYGGTGTDTVDFSGFGAAIWVWLGHSRQHAQTMDLPGLTGGNWRNVANVTDVENVVGSAYADYLAGDGNANRIDGGLGRDQLQGGGGADTFHYSSASEGADTIVDFTCGSGNDVLDIREVLVNYHGDIARFVRLGASGSDTIISVDANGTGASFVAVAALQSVAMSDTLLNDMLAQGNLIVA